MKPSIAVLLFRAKIYSRGLPACAIHPCQVLGLHRVFRFSRLVGVVTRIWTFTAPGKLKHTKLVAQRRVRRRHFETAPQPDGLNLGPLNVDWLNLRHDAWSGLEARDEESPGDRWDTTMRSWVPPLWSKLLSHENFTNEGAIDLSPDRTGTIAIPGSLSMHCRTRLPRASDKSTASACTPVLRPLM